MAPFAYFLLYMFSKPIISLTLIYSLGWLNKVSFALDLVVLVFKVVVFLFYGYSVCARHGARGKEHGIYKLRPMMVMVRLDL